MKSPQQIHREGMVEEIKNDFDSFRIVLTSVITHDTQREECLKELDSLKNTCLKALQPQQSQQVRVVGEIVKDLEKRQFEEPYCLGINYALGRIEAITNKQHHA